LILNIINVDDFKMAKRKKIKKNNENESKKSQIVKNKQLIWMLAKTDFKMRYHGSVLGYVWAILKPLLVFMILNFVFSQVIDRGGGIENYSLQLITGIIIWTFFTEGTAVGLTSFYSKSNIITKIYFPRWIVVISSTLNSLMVFLMNLIILCGFYVFYGVMPRPIGILLAILYIFAIYILILSFSFIFSPLFLKYRDLSQIWEVILQALFYASPIIYPLDLMPVEYHKIFLLNPIGMLIHYIKMVLIEGRIPSLQNHLIIFSFLAILFFSSKFYFNSTSKKIAENI
jgi:ABC-2 type transport system permease protein